MIFNRDISWLGFNHRVLQEAKDPSVPLYERLKFLAIFSSNLDEFFRVRYPTVMALSKLDKKIRKREAIMGEKDIAEMVQGTIKDQQVEFGSILNEELLPALKEHKVHLYYSEPIQPQHHAEVREIFLSTVLSFIQPIFLGVETSNDFMPENNQLYFIVTIKNEEKSSINHVAINIPSAKLQRFFELEEIDGVKYVIFIDDIIRENIKMFFPGQQVEAIYSIKFNRNAEISLDDDYTSDLLDKIEKKISKRDEGVASRFLYEKGIPANLRLFLASMFKIPVHDMFEGGRYHNLSDLFSFPVADSSLLYPKQKRILYPPTTVNGDIFNTITQQDVLLHLPYHSYTPVLSFFNQAAIDVDVTEIYITLYRVAKESHIVNALISAAKNGKKVTAFIELKARFDEANNIKWSRVMKQAGVRLIYSDPSIKVHSKIGLVKKKVKGKTTCFSVLSTGNFNETTASFYTDHVLMTNNDAVANELNQLIQFLQKKKTDPAKSNLKFEKLYVSQFNLIPDFEALIETEVKKAKKGLPALIRIKVNNLEEPYFINLLYAASQAGVQVQLIVRSICCLMPGVEGKSENIVVKRIVDRYLEHSRIFIFGSDDEAVAIMGSSDLMTRNLRRRIEVCIKMDDEKCRKQIIDYFTIQWADNSKAVLLLPDMQRQRIAAAGEARNAQSELHTYLQNLS
ncbi:MAG: polyphosphate kinase 1 [Chitinophagaceae bacterium]|nr:MAG: polyphosphate kinase 1 [Chitinophagaceae bacterium]